MSSRENSRIPNSLEASDVAYHFHPFTNLKQHQADGPLIIDRGEGVYVFDSHGRRLMEGMSGLWCTSLGFSNKRLAEAASRQLGKLPFNHTFRGRSHDVTIELAERLIARGPVAMSKVFFASSGSEANDTAVKLAWYYHVSRGQPSKRIIIARKNGYHGSTVFSSGLTGIGDLHRGFCPPTQDIAHTDCPHHYRFAALGESEEEFATRLAGSLERQILEISPDRVAAFIAEPVMGVGGVLVPPRTYFEKIQAVLRKYDVLMIADEIICGLGRTGNWWGSQTFHMQPDILTTAKALSSAYLPISAVMVTEQIYSALAEESDRIGVFGHGYTYSGHPVCAAVALEALKIYEEMDVVHRVRSNGARFMDGLRRLTRSSIVGNVRGVGLMAAVELVANKETKEPFSPSLKAGTQLAIHALRNGLIVRPIGDCIVMAPPLIITESEIDKLLGSLEAALGETEEILMQSAAVGTR